MMVINKIMEQFFSIFPETVYHDLNREGLEWFCGHTRILLRKKIYNIVDIC